MSHSKKLDETIHKKLVAFTKNGDALFDRQQYNEAIVMFNHAYRLLPEPKHIWEASTWIHVAIGDALFMQNDWKGARLCFRIAVEGVNGLGNPFIHFRLGQIAFELGESQTAKNELMRAFMGAGKDIFLESDSKYFDAISKYVSS